MVNTVKTLHSAKKTKNDEFYTQRSDVDAELRHYKKHFKGKTVYCNCDDPRVSSFFYCFSYQFERLGLKRLVTTCYKNDNMELFSRHDKERSISLEYNGKRDANGGVPKVEDIGIHRLKGDGDFRSAECIELLKQVDIVVTNPPFSLFREYVTQLIKYKKKFLIIGSMNAITYKEIFPLFKNNKMWLGNGFSGGNAFFRIPSYAAKEFAKGVYDEETGLVKFRNVTWFTNIDHKKRHQKLHLARRYNSKDYPEYDNYPAINVNKVIDIPQDYPGEMGVPISFLDKFNPEQFEIVKFRKGNDDKDLSVGGKLPYFRIIIKNKTPKRRK